MALSWWDDLQDTHFAYNIEMNVSSEFSLRTEPSSREALSFRADPVSRFWIDLLGCTRDQTLTPWIAVLPVSPKSEELNSVSVVEWKEGGTIVTANESLIERVRAACMKNIWDVESAIRSVCDVNAKHWPVVTCTSFWPKITYPSHTDVRLLTQSDTAHYEQFMRSCDPQDIKSVCMDFANPFHVFYGYFEAGHLVSLANFIREDDMDQLAHIGILTTTQSRGKWYSTATVGSLLNDITENGYTPQWRARADNPTSLRMAESFGFSEILRGYSLAVSSETVQISLK